ncbi:MAG: hypothetical protein U1E36_03900 [Rickettsiales bacterium]
MANFFFRYSIESVEVRDYLRNIFLENSQQAADGINTMIRYRQSVGDEAMKSIIYSIKNTDRPFDGPWTSAKLKSSPDWQTITSNFR